MSRLARLVIHRWMVLGAWCCSRPSWRHQDPNSNGIDPEICGSGANINACPSTWCVWGNIVLFLTPSAVELLVWRGVLGWGQPISMSVWRNGTMYFATMKIPASSNSASEDMTKFNSMSNGEDRAIVTGNRVILGYHDMGA